MPDHIYPSVNHIPWESLRENYSTIIFDADNTLGPWLMKELEEVSMKPLRKLIGQEFRIGVLSNSRMIGRKLAIETKLNALGIPLMVNAKKPMKAGYLQMMALIHAKPETTIFVGDQWITDIVGAKRLGLKAIMVKPFSPKSEAWWSRWRRLFEWVLLKVFYQG